VFVLPSRGEAADITFLTPLTVATNKKTMKEHEKKRKKPASLLFVFASTARGSPRILTRHFFFSWLSSFTFSLSQYSLLYMNFV
jgi:hypothetical protein